MKHIKLYKDFKNTEELNEGLKEWLIGGLMALSSAAFSQSNDGIVDVESPITKTEYQIHMDQLDYKAIDGFIKYANKIKEQKDKIVFSEDDGHLLIKGKDFSATSKESKSKYTVYSCYIIFGDNDPLKLEAQININLKDDGVISIMFGEERLKEDKVIGGFVGTYKKGSQLLTQTELRKGDKGYSEAMNIINIFSKK
jgi:hypothetical protein